MASSLARRSHRLAAPRGAVAMGLVLSLAACTSTPPAKLFENAARDANLIVASLFAPVGPKIRRLTGSPMPAEKPGRPLSQTLTIRDPRTGEAMRLTPRRLGGGAVEIVQSDGCIFRRGDWFAPSSAWRDCGDSKNWHTGRAAVVGGDGLWPLRVGAQTRFSRRATSHTGRSYTRDTTCRVKDAVEVIRSGRAPTAAFVVDCADGKRVRTTWWSPDEGPVAFRRTHDDRGIEELWIAE